jgi:hypothetical protein
MREDKPRTLAEQFEAGFPTVAQGDERAGQAEPPQVGCEIAQHLADLVWQDRSLSDNDYLMLMWTS